MEDKKLEFRIQGRKCTFWRCVSELLWGEWWFWRGRPNGGTVIFWRALQISFLVYLPALWMHSFLSAECPACHLSWTGFEHTTDTTLQWLAAIFGAVWAGLYARFASQWTYLAGEYNQIRQALATRPQPTSENNHHSQMWRAGFIEDALDLHLATKPMFVPFLKTLLEGKEHQEVRDYFDDKTVDGPQRREWLQKKLIKVTQDHP
jgi:hypothetical protein